jgi:hypothetical protein
LIGRSRIQRTGAKDALARLENQKTVFHFRTGDGGWMFARSIMAESQGRIDGWWNERFHRK